MWSEGKSVYRLSDDIKKAVHSHLKAIENTVMIPRETCDDVYEMAYLCSHIWLAAVKLGDRHPVRHRIVHSDVIRAFEDGCMRHIRKAYSELTQALDVGQVLMSSHRHEPSQLPAIDNLSDFMEDKHRLMFLLVYINEMSYQLDESICTATITGTVNQIKHLRNIMAHSTDPEGVFDSNRARHHVERLIGYYRRHNTRTQQLPKVLSVVAEQENLSPQSQI